MKQDDSEVRRRFGRAVVLLVADFRQAGAGTASALRELGVRVDVAGLGAAPERDALAALGIDAEGVSRLKGAVLPAALGRFMLADAVLFGAGDWEAEREEMLDQERELAIADGRPPRPLLSSRDERYAFLRSEAEWAAFTAARAAGAPFEPAREFALRAGPRKARGHKDEDRKPGSGARGRAASTKRGKAG